jgi:hypothetical protein
MKGDGTMASKSVASGEKTRIHGDIPTRSRKERTWHSDDRKK